jgi:5-methylcytosine-specific restriction endonuclease McrA
MIIGHKNTLITVLPLIDLYEVYNEHRRLKVFVHKGRECVVCGREGVLLLQTEGPDGRKHIDLYTEDFILMTVDHIYPRKQARRDGLKPQFIESLENKQTMCEPCNGHKGSKQLTVEEQRKNLQKQRKLRTGPELIRAFVQNNGIFDRKLPETLAF